MATIRYRLAEVPFGIVVVEVAYFTMLETAFYVYLRRNQSSRRTIRCAFLWDAATVKTVPSTLETSPPTPAKRANPCAWPIRYKIDGQSTLIG